MLRYLADAYKALRQTVPDGRQDRRARRPHRVARRAGPPGRLQPARRVGAAAQPGAEDGRRRSARATTASRRRSPATRGRSGCWCATRCSAGSSWPPCAAGRPGRAGRRGRRARPDAVAGRDRGVLRRARRPRHRPGRPRPAAAADRGAARAGGGCARSSTTPPATTTGASRAEVDLAASDEAGEAVVPHHRLRAPLTERTGVPARRHSGVPRALRAAQSANGPRCRPESPTGGHKVGMVGDGRAAGTPRTGVPAHRHPRALCAAQSAN